MATRYRINPDALLTDTRNESPSMTQEYQHRLPINGMTFHTSNGDWSAEVAKWPMPQADSTILVYEIDFHGPSLRRL